MTDHQHPQHCDHECVCKEYLECFSSEQCDGMIGVPFRTIGKSKLKKCRYDTRSHSSATEPERCKQPKEICDECDLDWLECGIDVEVCEQEKHDAAVAQAVREEVLDDITKYVVKHTRDDKALRLDVVTRYPLIEFLKSLRSGGKC